MSDRVHARAAARAELPDDCRREELLVAFFDLSRMAEWASDEQDERVAAFFQQLYALAAGHVEPAGGRVVKFMGDAGLAVFRREAAEAGIFALCALTGAARAAALAAGLDAYLNVSVHFGPVLAGTFGAPDAGRYDVIGKTVNVAARLGGRGVVLSAQAFRCLGAEGRERFAKITRPVTYAFRG